MGNTHEGTSLRPEWSTYVLTRSDPSNRWSTWFVYVAVSFVQPWVFDDQRIGRQLPLKVVYNNPLFSNLVPFDITSNCTLDHPHRNITLWDFENDLKLYIQNCWKPYYMQAEYFVLNLVLPFHSHSLSMLYFFI